MLITLPELLSAHELQAAQQQLVAAPWTDGETVFVDPSASGRTQLESVAVQASLIAAGSRDKKATEALTHAALSDGTALVRQAALLALAKVDAEASRSVAQQIATKDAEPRVRDTARTLGGSR